LKKIVVVATQAEGGLVKSFRADTRNREIARREKRLLNVFGALKVPAERTEIARIRFVLPVALKKR
jgi:hypothetical protein